MEFLPPSGTYSVISFELTCMRKCQSGAIGKASVCMMTSHAATLANEARTESELQIVHDNLRIIVLPHVTLALFDLGDDSTTVDG